MPYVAKALIRSSSAYLGSRSSLPILPALVALALGLGASAPALALDHVYLDPASVHCNLVPVRGGAQQCNVAFDALTVHEGRETGVAESNGDCVKCLSVVGRAKAMGRDVVMLRGYVGNQPADWHLDEFFTVAGEEACR